MSDDTEDLWDDDDDIDLSGSVEDDTSLTPLRMQIDEVDAKIVGLLGQRFSLTREVGQIKADTGLPSQDPTRESHQRLRLALLADEQGIDAATVLRVFDLIRERVVEEHDAIKDESSQA